ncbi:MAG: serine/threonine protein kinase [Deltaproteobacteria bacterium]|nr:serine/threonine protein kinase [Deltaproteobacteria bacterium]
MTDYHDIKINPAAPITNRFELGITDRFISPGGQPHGQERLTEVFASQGVDAHRITGVFSQQPPDFLSILGLQAGALVDDRYRVEEGPLGGISGEAEIYRCVDSLTASQVVLKFYLIRIRPKQGVIEKLRGLRHPDIVSILGFGQWMDRFYEVMEYCAGGTLMDDLPVSEDDISRLLPEMVTGVQFLHDQGIIHRDIKPNNIYFRRPGRQDLVIGDFGISSLVADDKTEGVFTSSYSNYTIDYAPPELVFKGEISRKTDYYSLGITLIHALLGSSPFHGMERIAIMGALYSAPLTIPPQISAGMRLLLTGLTQHEATNRWGYSQVWQWRHGEKIMADSGLAWREGHFNLRSDPYPRCKNVKTPKELAAVLDQFDAEGDLFHGDLGKWVFPFDPKAADRIKVIVENYEDKPKLALVKLAFLLDPSLPLVLDNGRQVTSIEELIELLTSDPDLSLRQTVADALYSERLECWLEETQEVNDKAKLLASLAALRIRLNTRDLDTSITLYTEENKRGFQPDGTPRDRDTALAIFALLYTLAPQTPLVLRDGVAIDRLEDLEEAIAQAPGLETRVAELLFDGRLAEWLLAVFPERHDDLTFLQECPRRYVNDRRLAVWVLRWRIKPSIGFPFGSENAADPKKLAALIDRTAQGTALGLELLQNGWIQTWLETTGRLPDAEGFSSLVNDTAHTWRAKLESVLHLLDPALPWPKPEADLPILDVGGISGEAIKAMPLTVANAGRGYLTGLITLAGDNGITLQTADGKIEGRPITVEIQFSALGLALGSRPRALVIVQTPGGNLEVPVTFRVIAPLPGMIGRSLGWGLLWGGGLGFFRWIFGMMTPDFANKVMSSVTWEQAGKTSMVSCGIFGLVLAILLGGTGYYLVRMLNRRGND